MLVNPQRRDALIAHLSCLNNLITRHRCLHLLDLLTDVVNKPMCDANFNSSLNENVWALVLVHLLEVKVVLEHHLARLSEWNAALSAFLSTEYTSSFAVPFAESLLLFHI